MRQVTRGLLGVGVEKCSWGAKTQSAWRAEEPQISRENSTFCLLANPAGIVAPFPHISWIFDHSRASTPHLADRKIEESQRDDWSFLLLANSGSPLGAGFHYPAGPFTDRKRRCVSDSCPPRLNTYPLTSLPAAVIALFCRQYDIIKDNDSSNNKEKAKPMSERSTPEHHSGGGLLRSKVSPANKYLGVANPNLHGSHVDPTQGRMLWGEWKGRFETEPQHLNVWTIPSSRER